MPRDVSSSSSGDEEGDVTAETPPKRTEPEKTTTRYQCPADFVSFCHKPCSSTLTESLKNSNNQLWLIKAPVSFNPESLSGIKVPLLGLQTLKFPSAAGGSTTGSSQNIYSILASPHCTSELRLLSSDKQSGGGGVLGPAFSGLLNVCESFEDSSANWTPQVVPVAPTPSIPPGLKQRFQPFGCKTPTLTGTAEDEGDGAACGPPSTAFRPLGVKRSIEVEQEEDLVEKERKKKKKKKKEKQITTEREEVEELVTVKMEPAAEICHEVMMEHPSLEGHASEEKRKKKKKKKDREREEAEEEVGLGVTIKEEEVTVKCEPTDTSYGDVAEELGKKKKKKKKSKTNVD